MIVAYALSVHAFQSLEWSEQRNYLQGRRKLLYNEDNPEQLNS